MVQNAAVLELYSLAAVQLVFPGLGLSPPLEKEKSETEANEIKNRPFQISSIAFISYRSFEIIPV